MQTNHFLLFENCKNTESAQLCDQRRLKTCNQFKFPAWHTALVLQSAAAAALQ